jgi:predicted AlkP superfamily phosphohydrolase/phosphomutase
LLIGIDAMEWNLVTRWAEQGKLPTFRRLMQEGLRAKLGSTAAQLPDTVWAASYTGMNPAKYQKYFYVQYDAATQGLKHVSDEGYRATAFWQHLGRAGVTTGVADPAKWPISRESNGYQIANWGAHATKAPRGSNPPELWQAIMNRFGEFPVRDCDAVDDKPAAQAALGRDILDGVRKHGQLFRWLMRERPTDVFYGAFSAPHCAGHHFWRFMDPEHPRYDPENRYGFRDTMQEVYAAIDSEIGEMMAQATPDTRVMVFAAHGMGPVYHASWNIPDILDLLGYGLDGTRKTARQEEEREASVNFWRILKMVMPGKLQYAIKSMLPRSVQDKLLFLWYSGGQKWQGARAFAVPNNDAVGSIRIAVKGRDKYGIVERGEEYRRICHDIRDAFLELADPVSGRNVVVDVTLTHEAFHGPHIDNLPDITVLWDQSFAWQNIRSPRFGTLKIRRQDGRTGSHTAHGFVVAAGPGIAPGIELTGRHIYDIAPTVLETAGVALPADLDGRPLPVTKAMAA